MNRWVALAAGSLVLLGASFLIRELACSRAPSAKQAPPSAPVVAQRAASTEPPAPPAEAHGPVQKAPPTARPAAPEPPAQAPPMPPTGHFDALRRAFESESRDSQWAGPREARIVEIMKEVGFADGAFDRDVDCRRTLCRLRLRVTEQSEPDMFSLMKLASAVQTSAGVSLAYGDAEVVGDKVQVIVLIPSEASSLEP